MQIKVNLKFSVMRSVMLIAWTVSLFGYFFQFPISRLSSLIVPGLAVYLVGMMILKKGLPMERKWTTVYFVYLFYLLLMAGVSLAQDTGIGTVVRFLLILSILPLFAVMRFDEFKPFYTVFILLAVAKCLLLLYYGVILIRSGDYTELREWAELNHFGDIYINPSTHLPKIQVQGNGILPMALILNIIYGKKNIWNYLLDAILAIGIFLAGNAAYLLGIAAYFGYKLYKNLQGREKTAWVKLASLMIILVGGAGFAAYAVYTLGAKSDYADAVRLEQAKALMDNYIIVGNGLGHGIYYTGVMRSYSGDTYFELQTLYIFNQIGLIGMFMFYWLVFNPIRAAGRKVLILFLIYLLYTFWNPYCFDSTEMIVISLLVNYPAYIKRQSRILPIP